ncbi:MFS transporter [Photobacterium lipolyticum]|uniref:MFS transporter n=1 Tax=Photobacterium lipolyticum TaxID=266810 RepID=UPI001FE864D2|nr:MFS transporter [Photobacterium lipolyticum]
MTNTTTCHTGGGIFVPVAGLTIFAIASGYLMSLIPLAMGEFKIDTSYASWLASIFYVGLLIGSMMIEPVIDKIGHRIAFVSFLASLALTVAIMPLFPHKEVWLFARLVAGMAVAGIFVVVESWLLIGDDKKERAKRLGFYMTALYGGTTLGQFGIGLFGISGFGPFIVILTLVLIAILPPLLIKQGQPVCESHHNLTFKQITRLSKPAVVGCATSGIVMGSIYGLMPLGLRQSGISDEKIGLLMAAIILGGMMIQPIISALAHRMSKTLLLAMMCLVGVFAMGLIYQNNDYFVLMIALALLGMSAFTLYPIAITLACDELDSSFIVSATQIMLFSYSVGSAAGPMIANRFMIEKNGLMDFFFIVLLSTAIYMLFSSIKRKPQVLAN